jgi:hypothetical protein
MRIGFDLDNIFIHTPPMIPGSLIEKFYKERDNGILRYRIPSKPDQLLRQLIHFPILRPPMKDNLAFLKTLMREDNQLYLISSRFKFLEKRTKQLIKRHKLDTIFDGLYFNFENKQPHEFKNEMIQKLKLDMFIDDDLSLLNFVAKHNPKTKFFLLHQAKPQRSLARNVTQIRKLEEILKRSA